MKHARVYLFLALANLFWAGNFVLGAMVVTQVSPISLTFSRWFCASFLLVPLAWLIERVPWRRALAEWRLHALQSTLGLLGYTLFLYWALGFTTPLTAAVISAANPALIALAAALFLGDKLGAARILGLVLAFGGALIVLSGGDIARILENGLNPGDLLIVAAMLSWTGYTLVGRRLTTPPVTATAVQAVFAVILLAPFVALFGLQLPADAAGFAGLAYIILFPSVAAYALWNLGARRIGPARAGVFLNLLPVFTVLISVLLGQALTPALIAGGVLVLAGIVLTSRPARRGGARGGAAQQRDSASA
ncbi:DMT family transporter [Microterricola viridarii]|uniref:DMT family transporter n=1 Tax=Microterricola viridarii TaxID=412690 RepID=UPI0012EA6A30|nr:DMT family transporter [Microterricola viridarii]